MPRQLLRIRSLLYSPGLKHTGLKLKNPPTRVLVEVWGGATVDKWVVEDKVTDLFTAMVEEFDEYDDSINVLHIANQDKFFDAVSRRVLWLQNIDREVLGEFIRYCVDARKNYLAGVFNPRFPPPGDGLAARAIHGFLILYEQEEKRQKMREMKAEEEADMESKMDENNQKKKDRTAIPKAPANSIQKPDFTAILMRTEGFVWDQITFKPHVREALSEAWSSIADPNPRKETNDLFRYMAQEWHSYDDHKSISQLRQQEKFLEVLFTRVRWLKNFPKDILCEYVTYIVAAREQHTVHRMLKPTAKRRPDSYLASTVQRFMDLYKIRREKKLLTPEETSMMPNLPTKAHRIENQINVINGDQDDVLLRGDDIASAFYNNRKVDSSQRKPEVKRLGGSGKKDSGLPLRTKSMHTDRIQKKKMDDILKRKEEASKKNGGGSRMVGAPDGPFLMRKDRLPAYLARQGEKNPKESLDLPGFESGLKLDG